MCLELIVFGKTELVSVLCLILIRIYCEYLNWRNLPECYNLGPVYDCGTFWSSALVFKQ